MQDRQVRDTVLIAVDCYASSQTIVLPAVTSFSDISAFTVQVPATSANLGPGFDALGVALSLYNRFHFTIRPAGPSRSEATGEGAQELNQSGGGCLVLQAARQAAEIIGGSLPPLHVRIESEIPIQRGLGSSASAVVAGIVAADFLLASRLSADDLLFLAALQEGHADNVAPALRGGFQTALYDGKVARSLRLPVPPDTLAELHLIVCVPEMPFSTARGRAVLPDHIAHADAVFNVGRATLLTASLCTGNYSLLRLALQDRLHQPYRAPLIPGFAEVIEAAESSGAHGVCLSGSGSTMLSLAPQECAEAVGRAMCRGFGTAGYTARWWNLTVDEGGARTFPCA